MSKHHLWIGTLNVKAKYNQTLNIIILSLNPSWRCPLCQHPLPLGYMCISCGKNLWGVYNWNKAIVLHVKEVICGPSPLPSWILLRRSGLTFPLRPNMVWLMWFKWGLWNTLAIHHYLVFYLVLSSLAGRPPQPCRVTLPLYVSRGILKGRHVNSIQLFSTYSRWSVL